MTWSDIWLLAKKILVGIAITLVPLVILAAGLWLTQRLAGNQVNAKHADAKQSFSTKAVTYAN
jgi:hypothetical protein